MSSAADRNADKIQYDETLVQLLVQYASIDFSDSTQLLPCIDRAEECGHEKLRAFLDLLHEHVVHYPNRVNQQVLFTGSRCYGTPGPKSDIDLVLKCNKQTSYCLGQIYADSICDDYGNEFPDADSYSYNMCDVAMRIGPINLICVSNIPHWRAWVNGTADLLAMKMDERLNTPTREHAVARFAYEYRRQRAIYTTESSPEFVRTMIDWTCFFKTEESK